MNHESFRELIALGLYGELDGGERSRLDRHLEQCAACRRYASEMEQGLGRIAAESGAAPEGLPLDWSERLRAATGEVPRRSRISPWWTAAAGFAAGVVAAAMIGRGQAQSAVAEHPPTTWERFHGEASPPLATTEGRLANLGEYLRR